MDDRVFHTYQTPKRPAAVATSKWHARAKTHARLIGHRSAFPVGATVRHQDYAEHGTVVGHTDHKVKVQFGDAVAVDVYPLRLEVVSDRAQPTRRGRSPSVWTEGRVADLRARWCRGEDDASIAEDYGLTVRAVELARSKHGIVGRSLRRGGLAEYSDETLEDELRRRGYSVRKRRE